MGLTSNSGFYLSRKVVVLAVVALGALLLSVAVLSSFVVPCSHTPSQPSEKSRTVPRAAPAIQGVAFKQQAEEEKKATKTSNIRGPGTRPSVRRPSWSWDHRSQSTSGPLNHPNLTTSGPLDRPTLSTSGPLDDTNLTTSGPLDHPTLSTSGPLDDTNQTTSGPLDHPTLSSSSSQPQSTSEPWKHQRLPSDVVRLPSDVVPLHYDLELWVPLQPDQIANSSKSFSGRLNITVKCVSPTTRVLIHSLHLDYEGAKVLGPLPEGPGADREQWPVGQVSVNNLWKFLEMEYLVMELSETLKPGSHYVLQFDFSGLVNQTDKDGLFRNLYTDQGETRALIASQLEPTHARRIFPCFDEPAMKATFSITIVHHPTYVALSNMPVLATSEREDVKGNKWIVTSFETTPLMSTYITAFAVCDYNYVNGTERGKEVRIWARKDAVAEGGADFALSIAGPIFSKLEDLFNVGYPLPKIDLIGFPIFNTQAMENWGLITFDDFVLVQEKDDHPERKSIILSTVAHEIAHQWFGNLVTAKWWNDIWLNEGFATYFEYYTTKHFDPQIFKFQNEFFYYSDMKDVYKEDHAMMHRTVSTEVKNYANTQEISDLFDLYIYKKGGCVIRMMSNFLSENLFLRGIESYLKTFAFSNAEQDDLWNHLQMVLDNQTEILLPASVKSIMDKWTHQSGFPIITLDVSTGMVNQEPFFLANYKNQMTTLHNNTWIVPITWTKNGIVQPLVWLDESSKIFPEMQLSYSEHDWVTLNLNTTGYYMVNYDQLGWKKISLLLQKDPKAIPATDRMKLFDDAFRLSWNDYIEIETVLDLTKYLAKEEEVIVWDTVLQNLLTSDIFVNLNNHDIYPLFKKYLLKRITPMWRIYSTKIRENNLEDDIMAILSLRSVFGAACWLGLEDCLQLSKEMFSKWMNHSEIIKNSNLITYEVMCYGIAMGSDREWDFLLNVCENKSEGNRDGIIRSLSCSKEPWILYRYMEYALNANLFGSDSAKVIQNVAATEVGRLVVKDFLVNNWQAVMEKFGKENVFYLAHILAKPISTNAQIHELQQLFGNMLGEKITNVLHTHLHKEMERNKQNDRKIAQIANWLKKNMAD
ncbi:aminopeptidase Q [Trichosurus vulpecula]|uniref:aminopeptidase Q n=1 Tax=Trichosurus vulpecula TaxID=9337 RepID=UPI00186AC0FC|nr:aminopeptidase Q [Trichosurus vulpecula]